MKRILLAAALVLVAADLSYGQTCTAWLNGAKARATSNKWVEANQVLGQNLASCEEDAEYRYFYGITLAQAFEADSTPKALEQLRAADELNGDPGAGDALQENIDQALLALWGPLVNDGIRMLNIGSVEEAQEKLDLAVQLNPEGKEGHYALGAVYQTKGEYDAAVEAYRKALEIDPAYKAALTRLGRVYQEKAEALASSGDAAQVAQATNVAAEAVAVYEQYLAENPDDLEIKIQLAGLYANLGQQDKAEPIIRELAGSEEVNAEVLTQLGFQQAQTGNNALAEELLARAVTLSDSLWSEPLQYLAFIRIREANLEGAKVALEKQLALDPSNAEAWEYLGFVLRDLEQMDAAREAFEKAQAIPLELQSAAMSQDADSTWNVDFTFSNRLESQVDEQRVQVHLVSQAGDVLETKEVTVGPLAAGEATQVRVEFTEKAESPRIRYEIMS